MAHTSATSMRAFTKGRCAFDSDEEYRAALRGELDDPGVHEDFGYGSGSSEDPDDGEWPDAEGPQEDAGDLEDLTDEEAVRAGLEDFEDRIGGTRFLKILERFMKDCSGRKEPPYLPFPPVRDKEVSAVFRDGSGGLRLRYGAYGLEADRLEGDEVAGTWRGLGADDVLDDWDDALCELAEEAEIEKEDLEEAAKDKFFDDTLPDILADRRRGAEFLGFVMDTANSRLGDRVFLLDGAEDGTWLRWTGEKTFVLREGSTGDVASWESMEFLAKLRNVAWDDPECRDCILGGGLGKAWDALDGAWYDEDEDDLVVISVEKFLAGVDDARKDPRVGVVQRDVAVCGEADTGRVEMKMVWSRTFPADALLTFSRDGGEETFSGIPLAFLGWWAFGMARGW